jgi:hypothetical protein
MSCVRWHVWQAVAGVLGHPDLAADIAATGV